MQNKMETEPILQLIFSMSLPPLCSMFMQQTYNFVDCMFVARMSEEALAAVSLSFPITTLMLSVSIGIGVGINVLVSRHLGEKNTDTANKVVSHGIIFSTVLGLILTVLLSFIIKSYFKAFVKDEVIYALCMEYMGICIFLQAPNMVHIAIQKMIQGTGNMIAPMLFQIAGVLLNFVLDPLLIFGIGPFPEMGISGAAISTVLGYTFSMIIAFYVLIYTKQKVKLTFKNFSMDFNIFKEIVVFGFPSFIMNALGAFMVSFSNFFLISYSTTAVAFFGAYFKAQQVVVMTVNGLIQGCIPIMSFNFGAKRYDRLRKAFIYGVLTAVFLMGLGEAVLSVFPAPILKIFMASDEMLSFGIPALRIMTSSYIFSGISTMAASYMQSTARVKYSIVINLFRQLILLLPVMLVLTEIFGMNGVWYAFVIAEVLTCLYCWYLLRREKTGSF